MYLHCHSRYSFRYGTLDIAQIVQFMSRMGVERMALTDINGTPAVLNFVRLARKAGVHPVAGIDFRADSRCLYVGIARSNAGYEALNGFLSGHLHSGAALPLRAPELPDTFFVYPPPNTPQGVLRPDEFIGIRPSDLPALGLSPLQHLRHRWVAMPTATFGGGNDFNVHRLLRAIDNNMLLSKLPRSQEANAADLYHPPARLREIYGDRSFLLDRSEALLSECSLDFDIGEGASPKNQQTYTGSKAKDLLLLRKLCEDNLPYRYGHSAPTPAVRQRLEKELDIIAQKAFTAYFLINWDIVNYARRRNYFYVGRGSGANSIVAYLLRITDVDPIDLDLYFERFINLYRRNPPDFDIDFSWRDRQDVTDYIFKRFPHTALLAAYSTFQYRAVVRELGKVFGLPAHEIDRLSDARGAVQHPDKISQLVLRYGARIRDFPSHLTLHAGGILISQKPLHAYSATFMPPKGFATTQFDMLAAEDVGLYKFDILGQRGLGKIKDAVDIVAHNRPYEPRIDIHDMHRLRADESIKSLLRTGQAIGCFYVESPAMRMLLHKLRVDNYPALVAASSIIRPGVAKSGMMRAYIERYRFPERRNDAHPVMRDIMPETFGVMVYQEDVIKVAHYFAGLSLGEADVLRRGMSGKYRSRAEFKEVEEKFFDNCRRRGHPEALTAEIWRQIESFAGYAFSKGHSASYAVESYQSLYLKAHYPLEYMVAVINNGGGFYSAELYIHEARMRGAAVHAPCVNRSRAETCIYGSDIYLGMGMLLGFESRSARLIEEARDGSGAFADFDDFIDRVSLSVEQISILVRIGAFRFCGKSKQVLLWEVRLKLGHRPPEVLQPRLFGQERRRFALPAFASSPLEELFDQMELLGFPLDSPFGLVKQDISQSPTAADLPDMLGREIELAAYLVAVKDTRTVKGERMQFGAFVDRDGRWVDTVHFPQVAARYPFRGRGVYAIKGKVVVEFEFYSIEVAEMRKLELQPDTRYTDGRTLMQQRVSQNEIRANRVNPSLAGSILQTQVPTFRQDVHIDSR
jgi:DNA polymerase-3 subunit alpha